MDRPSLIEWTTIGINAPAYPIHVNLTTREREIKELALVTLLTAGLLSMTVLMHVPSLYTGFSLYTCASIAVPIATLLTCYLAADFFVNHVHPWVAGIAMGGSQLIFPHTLPIITLAAIGAACKFAIHDFLKEYLLIRTIGFAIQRLFRSLPRDETTPSTLSHMRLLSFTWTLIKKLDPHSLPKERFLIQIAMIAYLSNGLAYAKKVEMHNQVMATLHVIGGYDLNLYRDFVCKAALWHYTRGGFVTPAGWMQAFIDSGHIASKAQIFSDAMGQEKQANLSVQQTLRLISKSFYRLPAGIKAEVCSYLANPQLINTMRALGPRLLNTRFEADEARNKQYCLTVVNDLIHHFIKTHQFNNAFKVLLSSYVASSLTHFSLTMQTLHAMCLRFPEEQQASALALLNRLYTSELTVLTIEQSQAFLSEGVEALSDQERGVLSESSIYTFCQWLASIAVDLADTTKDFAETLKRYSYSEYLKWLQLPRPALQLQPAASNSLDSRLFGSLVWGEVHQSILQRQAAQ